MGKDLPLMPFLYRSDRKLSHLTTADFIFENPFPANSEKFSIRNRSSRVTCKLNVIMSTLTPSPSHTPPPNNNNNTLSILFCFSFRQLTDTQTYNELRSALLEQQLDLDSIENGRMGRLDIKMAASRNDDVRKK